jgi:hypothetical protein
MASAASAKRLDAMHVGVKQLLDFNRQRLTELNVELDEPAKKPVQ